VISRVRLVVAGLLAFLLALAAMAVSAAACGGGGGGGGGKEPTTLTTTLSGESKEGGEITVSEGAKVKDKAKLSGKNVSKATGKVKYDFYSDSKCEHLVAAAGEGTVSGESVTASSEENPEAGKAYYWQATYEGNETNDSSTSTCSSELLDDKASTSLSTDLSGESKEGDELTIQEGHKVDDDATLAGTNHTTATGKVTYKVYSNSSCTTLVKEAGDETLESAGKIPDSTEEELEAGKTYYWQAHYEGDTLHDESTSSCDEIDNVKAKTTLTTDLTGESKEGDELTIQEGHKVDDDATLAGTNHTTATGKVTYKVYSNSSCTTLVATAGEETIEEGTGKIPDSTEEELEAGKTYYWQAHYEGDTLHDESTSSCDEIDNVKAKTTLTTDLTGESKEGDELTVNEGHKVDDDATLGGTNHTTATGKVTYKVYSNNSCTTLVKEAGDETLESGGKIPDSTEEELEAGKTYYWQAHYEGDTLHDESTSSCDEILYIKAATTLTTDLTGESKEGTELTIQEGAKIDDDATLAGTNHALAGGSVDYYVYSDKECKDLVAEAGEVSVSSGSVPDSSDEALPVGIYYWQAVYSGDDTHQPSTSSCDSEIATVRATTSLTTTLSGGGSEGATITVNEGTDTSDDATIGSMHASEATGSVKYYVYSDKECKDLVAAAGEGSVEDGFVSGSDEEALPPGVYYWKAVYSGDALDEGSTSNCGSEVETVKAVTSLTTSLSGGEETGSEVEVEEGEEVDDDASLHGKDLASAAGTVVYDAYSDPACENLAAKAGEVTVVEGSISSSSKVKLSAGKYYWRATYSGDGEHTESASSCGSEIMVVNASTSLTTELSGEEGNTGTHIEVEEGIGVSDAATLSGTAASTAGGTVEYDLYSDNECKDLVAEASDVGVTEGEIPESNEVTLPAGTYYWKAVYSGDMLDRSSSDACGSEVETVKAGPVTTELSGEGQSGDELEVQESAEVSDQATLHIENPSTATGTVDYDVYSDNECTELVAVAGEEAVTEGHASASNVEKLSPGTYYWQATYSGDETHSESKSACGSEVEEVADATSLTTSLSGEGKSGTEIEVQEGQGVSDHATLTGTKASESTGIVEYAIYSDNKCEHFVKDAGTVNTSGETIPASSEEQLKAGTYYWLAVYSGDSLNQSSHSTCGSEVEIVKQAPVTTSLSGDGESGEDVEAQVESEVEDSASLHGSEKDTTGEIKYAIYTDKECVHRYAYAGEDGVSEDRVPSSDPESLPEGTYYWQATYTNAETSEEFTSACGSEVEEVVAQKSWIVSLGDSYISGEGGRWAGNTRRNTLRQARWINALPNEPYSGAPNDEGAQEAIPLCHRSKSAEIFIWTDLAGNKVKSKNFACSGAEALSESKGTVYRNLPLLGWRRTSSAPFKPGLDFADAVEGQEILKNENRGFCGEPKCQGQAKQLEVFAAKRNMAGEAIPMVVVSVGGNDFQFANVVRACVKRYVKNSASGFLIKKECQTTEQPKLLAAQNAVQKGIEGAINNVGEAMKNAGYAKGAFTILVQDYPSAIPEGPGFRYAEGNVLGRTKVGACPFTNGDATWANTFAVKMIDETVEKAYKNINKYQVAFMQLEKAFNPNAKEPQGRRLCEKNLKLVGAAGAPATWKALGAPADSEWFNQLRFWTGVPHGLRPFFMQEDYHPNYWAQLALRNCVRQAYKNGAPVGGTCTLEGPGLTGIPRGVPPVEEPVMEFK
jgi:uncharacterized cupredoxin-like copper-binding protein